MRDDVRACVQQALSRLEAMPLLWQQGRVDAVQRQRDLAVAELGEALRLADASKPETSR